MHTVYYRCNCIREYSFSLVITYDFWGWSLFWAITDLTPNILKWTFHAHDTEISIGFHLLITFCFSRRLSCWISDTVALCQCRTWVIVVCVQLFSSCRMLEKAWGFIIKFLLFNRMAAGKETLNMLYLIFGLEGINAE